MLHSYAYRQTGTLAILLFLVFHFPAPGAVIYQSPYYTVHSDSVVDTMKRNWKLERHVARAPDSKTLVSDVVPAYRFGIQPADCGWSETWTADESQLSQYPSFTSGHNLLDAVYNLALETLYRCTFEYGSDTTWDAGYHNCDDGYGVWHRDVVYCALLTGNLLDPRGARGSIKYISSGGKHNNGQDGFSVPAWGVWDYYLATGDETLIHETYPDNAVAIDKIPWFPEEGLGEAIDPSFIDCNGCAPWNNARSFSTEITYMHGYHGMAEQGKIVGEEQTRIDEWEGRAATLRTKLNELYFHPEAGFYTPGPAGSEGYEKQYWENLGQSFAIWPRYGIATPERRQSVIDNMGVAWTPFGFHERFYESGMHGNNCWIFTEVGEAAAFAAEREMDKLLHLFASAARAGAVHKTFMELITTDDNASFGVGSRYPGQLWHAMGYIAMIYYGLLGMHYDEAGLHFTNACVPEVLASMRITGLNYRGAKLDINVNGWGYLESLVLDGSRVEAVPTSVEGRHVVDVNLSRDAVRTGEPASRRPVASPTPTTTSIRCLGNGRLLLSRPRGRSAAAVRVFSPDGRVVFRGRSEGVTVIDLSRQPLGRGVALVEIDGPDGGRATSVIVDMKRAE